MKLVMNENDETQRNNENRLMLKVSEMEQALCDEQEEWMVNEVENILFFHPLSFIHLEFYNMTMG